MSIPGVFLVKILLKFGYIQQVFLQEDLFLQMADSG